MFRMTAEDPGRTPSATAAAQSPVAKTEGRGRRAAQRLVDAFRRARAYGGPERETLFLLFKSGLAGVIAWVLAEYAVASTQPTYAPFTALLVVQSTAYRSLLQTLRYVLAVVIGVLAAGAVGPVLGQNALGFAVMLAAALVVGRWQRLGSQGLQVSVAAIFAFNALSGTPAATIGEIISMALLGAAVGLGIAMFILPPLRLRTAAQGLTSTSGALCSLMDDVAEGIRDGMPERDTVADWLQRSRELDKAVEGARTSVESGSESVIWNPRRLVRRSTPAGFTGYRTLVEALARAGEHMRSICYGLRRILEEEQTPAPDRDFLARYSELLKAVAKAPGYVGAEPHQADGNGPLESMVEEARALHRDLVASADGTSPWATHGVLLTDADRLLEEFSSAHANGAVHPNTTGDGSQLPSEHGPTATAQEQRGRP